MVTETPATLELDDIQRGVLHGRPTPYVATYLLLRIDDRRVGREMLRRLVPVVDSAGDLSSPASEAWVSVAFTFQGLKAFGVPQDSLDSFAPEFQQGMAARADLLGDVGESSPAHWEQPVGTPDTHVLVSILSQDEPRRDALLAQARRAYGGVTGVSVIYRQDAQVFPGGREPFGFKDGISHPAVEGSPIPGTNRQEPPLKAGEFVLGYPDETGALPPMPCPDVLGRNGSYVVIRKLHQRVAAFRQFLRAHATGAADEALLGAKMIGRWPSGAPLVLSPERDNPDLGGDPTRNNDFLYYADDPKGLRCPVGAHVRRTHARDAFKDELTGVNRLHRIIRRSTTYGPPLPDGVLEDDGADRGIVFIAVGAHLKRQFEFIQTQWINDGVFMGAPEEKDPMCGPNDGSGVFTIPQRPIRRRLRGLPRFVVTKGGEYGFTPGLRALRWLADLKT